MTATSQIKKMEPLVSVTGEGNLQVVPDGVKVKVRVESEGKEAKSVKQKNDRAIDAVIKFLRSEGVEAKNVKSEYINLNKNYNPPTKTYHYQANQSLTIILNDLAMYEPIISGLLSSGINRIDTVQFTSSKIASLQADARIAAIKNAREKASAYAEALGQSIGKATQISEVGTTANPVSKGRMMSMASSSNLGETMAPGELSITAKIWVSFILL